MWKKNNKRVSLIRFNTGQSQSGRQMLSQQKLVDLVSEVDPKQVLDEDVEEVRHFNGIAPH